MGLRVSRLSQVAAAAWRSGVPESEHVRLLAGLQGALHLGTPRRLVSEPQRTGEYSFRAGRTDVQFLYGTAADSTISEAVAKRGVHFHHVAVEVAWGGDGETAPDAIYYEARRLRDEHVNLFDQPDRAIDKARDPAVVQGADGGYAFFVHPKTTNDRGALGVLVEFNIPGQNHGEIVETGVAVRSPFVDRVSAVSIAAPEPKVAGELLQLLFGLSEPTRFTFHDAANHPVEVVEYPLGNVAAFRILSSQATDSDVAKFLAQPGSRIYSATLWTSSWSMLAYRLMGLDWLDPRDVLSGGIPRRRHYPFPGGDQREVLSLHPDPLLGLRLDIEGA